MPSTLSTPEVGSHEGEPLIGQGIVQDVYILVKPIEMSLRAKLLHYGARMSATAECGIYIYAILMYVESFYALIEQCRYVVNGVGH